jgi:branched-chain amino acid transport system substrate-binding protein
MKLARLVSAIALALVTGLADGPAFSQDKPAELKSGFTTFTSGAASVFGVPAKAAVELLIEEMNAAGGIGGGKLSATFIDEGVGGDEMLPECRRLAAAGRDAGGGAAVGCRAGAFASLRGSRCAR